MARLTSKQPAFSVLGIAITNACALDVLCSGPYETYAREHHFHRNVRYINTMNRFYKHTGSTLVLAVNPLADHSGSASRLPLRMLAIFARVAFIILYSQAAHVL
jgi:hypothetical protein